jgi:hypothetical protein
MLEVAFGVLAPSIAQTWYEGGAALSGRGRFMVISDQQLRDTFLTPQMKCYFEKKLPALSPVELEIRIEETLKFLNIATYCVGGIPVSKEIDEIWHLWILETQQYERLCQALQGRKFIHHSSNAYMNCNGDAVPSIEDELGQQAALLGTYVLNYGPFQADRVRYWTLAAHLVDNLGWSLEQLNEWLDSIL